jgi:hypothetical protein
MPYELKVIDNWDHHEGSIQDSGEFQTAEEVVAAAKTVIDRSLQETWESICREGRQPQTAKELYSAWCGFGDSTYIFPRGESPPVKPHFHPYDYAEARAEEIAEGTAEK